MYHDYSPNKITNATRIKERGQWAGGRGKGTEYRYQNVEGRVGAGSNQSEALKLLPFLRGCVKIPYVKKEKNAFY